jgi:cell division protein ZipA
MEISLRMILILFAVVIVGIILFDGWRRNGKRKVVITAYGSQHRDPRIDAFQDEREAEVRPEPLYEKEPEVRAVISKPTKTAQQAQSEPVQAPVIVLNLMNTQEPYEGPVMLQALLSTGLRYGDMSIFHRYTASTGQGPLQFSVASAVKPGTFNLEDIESFTTPGLTLFFAADQVPAPMASYDLLLEVVRKLEDRLGGNILDEQRKPLTADAINRHREALMQYESSCQLYG